MSNSIDFIIDWFWTISYHPIITVIAMLWVYWHGYLARKSERKIWDRLLREGERVKG